MAQIVRSIVSSGLVHTVVMEFPDNWATEKAINSKDAGDIQKLYTLSGMLVAHVSELRGVSAIENFYIVTPSGWKGQTPKRIIMDRVAAYCGIHFPLMPGVSDDAAEAFWLAKCVAIGPAPKEMINLFKPAEVQFNVCEYLMNPDSFAKSYGVSD